MAAFRPGNFLYTFSGTAGDARTLNNAFLSSLTGPGMLRIHPDHWLNSVMPGSFDTAAGPGGVAWSFVSMRLLLYLFLPSLIFTDALDATHLPFFPAPAFLSRFLFELLHAGMVLTPCSDWKDVRHRISTCSQQLPAAARTLDDSDVRQVTIANTWLTALTPSLLKGSSGTNEPIVSFMLLLPQSFVDSAAVPALLEAALAMLTPSDVSPLSPAVLVAVRAAAHAAITSAEPPFDFFLEYNDIMVELARRLEADEQSRYRPLFDRHYVKLYPELVSAFPSASGSAEMRHLVATLMLSFGLRACLTHAGVANICNLLSGLIPSLNLELPAGSTAQQRLNVLAKLHREQPGGRPAVKDGKSDGTDAERYDKLLSDATYLDLYTKILAADVANFNVTKTASILAAHPHVVGLIFLSTSRTPQQSAWTGILGVRQKTVWPAIFDLALQFDFSGVAQPNWGRMLPFDKLGCPTATHLIGGKLDQIKDWWSVCSAWVGKFEGKHVLAQYPPLADPADFWFDSSRLRLVEIAMASIFDAIGHGQSRASRGSFREFYARQIVRAEHISKLPQNVALFPDLFRRAKLAVTLVFSQYAEGHAAVLTRPFHSARRIYFIDLGGSVETSLTEIDDELIRVRSELSRAAEGLAAFQSPHLLQLGSASTSTFPPGMPPGLNTCATPPAAGVSTTKVITLPGSGASSSNTPAAYPAGVFKNWGNQSVKHGAWLTDSGLVFGNRLVCLRDGKGSVTFKHCMAAAGPNNSARGNSSWCVTPDVCKSVGYKAHERADGTTDDDYVVTTLDDDVDTSAWECIVAPIASLAHASPPDPPWNAFHGPSDSSPSDGKIPKIFDWQSLRRKSNVASSPAVDFSRYALWTPRPRMYTLRRDVACMFCDAPTAVPTLPHVRSAARPTYMLCDAIVCTHVCTHVLPPVVASACVLCGGTSHVCSVTPPRPPPLCLPHVRSTARPACTLCVAIVSPHVCSVDSAAPHVCSAEGRRTYVL